MQRVQESETLLSTLQQAFSDAKRNTQEQMVSSAFISQPLPSSCVWSAPVRAAFATESRLQISHIGLLFAVARSQPNRAAAAHGVPARYRVGFTFLWLHGSDVAVQTFPDTKEFFFFYSSTSADLSPRQIRSKVQRR